MKTFNKNYLKYLGICGVILDRKNWFIGIGVANFIGLTIGTHNRNSLCIYKWFVWNTFKRTN